mmetsp:Transcript_30679/g.94919  ORF Transcript_30679/g.94919 Transcript_30679/m.94919 type:complete len:85 (-) Transcript_30679:1945-2199(-)
MALELQMTQETSGSFDDGNRQVVKEGIPNCSRVTLDLTQQVQLQIEKEKAHVIDHACELGRAVEFYEEKYESHYQCHLRSHFRA